MAKQREIEVFGLSFMDVISCGLGGMLVLMFVFSTMVKPNGVEIESKGDNRSGLSNSQIHLQKLQQTFFILHVEVKGAKTLLKYDVANDKVWTLANEYYEPVGKAAISQNIAVINRETEAQESYRFTLTIKEGQAMEGSLIRLISDKEEVIQIDKNAKKIQIKVTKYGTKYEIEAT